MRNSIITKDIVRRFLVVHGVDSADVAQIVDGLLHDLPIRDVLDEIVMLIDGFYVETEVVEALTICAVAESMIRNVDAHHGRLSDTGAAIMRQAWLALDGIGISLAMWESSRQ